MDTPNNDPRHTPIGIPCDGVDEYVPMLWHELVTNGDESEHDRDLFLRVMPAIIREHEVSDEGYAMCHVITTDSLEKAWRNAQVSQGMRELMNEGRVQVLWCPDENDFVFQSTDHADPYGRIS